MLLYFLILLLFAIQLFTFYSKSRTFIYRFFPFNRHYGQLFIFLGPMFARKTTTLINELVTCVDANDHLTAIYINHADDVRTTTGQGDNVTTHSSQFRGLSPKISSCRTRKLNDVDVSKYDLIGIDEGQFYEDLAETVITWVAAGKVVFVSSLDGDYQKRPFGQTLTLIPHADYVIKLTAYCATCKQPAAFTARKTGGSSQIIIGGADTYRPACRRCHEIGLY